MVNTSVSDSNVNNNQTIAPVIPSTPNPVQPPAPIPVAPIVPETVSENPEDLDTRWTRWRCLNCNYSYEGREPLKKCPRCGNEDPDKFADVD